MNPRLERVKIEFDLVDNDIAEIIASSSPPDNVTVSKPAIFVKASAASNGGIFSQVAIQFIHDAHDVLLGLIAAWIYDCCKKSGKKNGRVNRDQIVYSEHNIRRIIKKELRNQRAREAQRRRDERRSPKKSS